MHSYLPGRNAWLKGGRKEGRESCEEAVHDIYHGEGFYRAWSYPAVHSHTYTSYQPEACSTHLLFTASHRCSPESQKCWVGVLVGSVVGEAVGIAVGNEGRGEIQL